MKLVSFEHEGSRGFGAVTGERIVDLTLRLGPRFPDVRRLLSNDGLANAAEYVASTEPSIELADVELLPPIPTPPKIFCIGINYRDRNAEYRDASQEPKYPSVFMRTPGSFVGHGSALIRPPESAQLDYEGEIAIVIGRPGRRIPRATARRHIAGLTCANEGTIRDWVRHGKFNVTQGKNFARTGALGPWMVTADELQRFDDLRVTTRVNGEVRQDDTTANLAFPFDYLINYLSTFAELEAGDLILTGTPAGAGARFDPPRYLVPGDVVEIDVPVVGKLVNPVADEETQAA